MRFVFFYDVFQCAFCSFAGKVQKMEQFSEILAAALETAARDRGQEYNAGGSLQWALAGQAYLSLALSGAPQARVRKHQYAARELTGPVLFDCHQYDRLCELCMAGAKSFTVLLPDSEGHPATAVLTENLFMEMLDFLREG